MPEHYPLISIVTPSFNQGAYIEETILSVLDQNYPNLQYIIIDGGSTDNTVAVIKKYAGKLNYWVSEPDAGMYDAIQKGFDKSDGEILSWINSDDLLSRNSLFTVAEVFNDYPAIEWLNGIPNHIDERGRSTWAGNVPRWNRYRYLQGDFEYIQQEGCFWRRALWQKAGGYISKEYKLAADLELWSRFFTYAQLYYLPGILGSFRARGSNQKSLDSMREYHLEATDIIKKMRRSAKEDKIIAKKNSRSWYLLKKKPLHLLRPLMGFSEVEEAINNYPPMLTFDRDKQGFILP